MSFTRAKSTGWTAGIDKITSAQMNQIDVNQSRAIDGTGGGVYQPATVIEIQGTAGLKVNGSSGAARLQYGSRSLTRTQRAWFSNLAGGTTSIITATVAAGEVWYQEMDRLPNGSTLTSVTVYHDRNGAAGATLPDTRVSFELFKRDITTGTPTSLGSVTDPNNSTGTYNVIHGFSLSSLSVTIDRTAYVYFIVFTGEGGANTQSTVLNGATCTMTVTDQDEAP